MHLVIDVPVKKFENELNQIFKDLTEYNFYENINLAFNNQINYFSDFFNQKIKNYENSLLDSLSKSNINQDFKNYLFSLFNSNIYNNRENTRIIFENMNRQGLIIPKDFNSYLNENHVNHFNQFNHLIDEKEYFSFYPKKNNFIDEGLHDNRSAKKKYSIENNLFFENLNSFKSPKNMKYYFNENIKKDRNESESENNFNFNYLNCFNQNDILTNNKNNKDIYIKCNINDDNQKKICDINHFIYSPNNYSNFKNNSINKISKNEFQNLFFRKSNKNLSSSNSKLSEDEKLLAKKTTRANTLENKQNMMKKKIEIENIKEQTIRFNSLSNNNTKENNENK